MRRFLMAVLFGTLTLAIVQAIGCGGGNNGSNTSSSSSPSQGISGAWEFVAKSSSTGSTTLIEADISVNGSKSSASGPSQVQTATYSKGTWYVNGACAGSSLGQNSFSGTVSGSSITLTFNEGGNTFSGQGTINGTSISGTYSGTNANCSDSGTFTATQVPNLAGTFAGALTFPQGADGVTATLTEGSGYSLSAQTTLSGADIGSFTFSGSAVGNVMFVSGTVNGIAFSLFGYFDSSGQFTGTPNSIAVFDDNTLTYYGLLVKPGSTSTTQNTQPIVVNGGPPAAINVAGIYPNGAFTSVTVCVPGSTTSCQSIDGILVDTGSVGLRILSSASGGELTLALPAATISGNPVAECEKFVDMSFLWGPVETADVKIAGEVASPIPVHVVGDTTFSTIFPVPASCGVAGSANDNDSLIALGANGILGVGSFPEDCGGGCAPGVGTAPSDDPYYVCPSSGCAQGLVGVSQQVQNPVSLFAADNNGVIITLPAVSSPQPSITGSMIFGIGTQPDNALGGAKVFPLDSTTFDFTTNYKNVAYHSFIDSGSNGVFFLDTATTTPSLAVCASSSSWFCPSSPVDIAVTNQATGGTPDQLNFTVGNFDSLTAGSNAAIDDLSGPNPGVFDFGLPFFYGRTVFTSILGSTAPGGATPYWAY